ncbi:uncharacterized protein ZBAI_09855 [Zygosaccharomyces bailii ISA1307]|nr:uncharacterized protein ZBAI_09855 [Zygosaccharomyces bailii ISA1307]
MTQKEYSDTPSRNSIPHRHGISPQLSNSCIADVQRNKNGRPGAQGSDGPAHTEKVPNKVRLSALKRMKVLGSGLILFHLIALLLYGSFGLSSREEDNYASIFVYGGSIITFSSFIVLCCADNNQMSSSVGAHWAKAGLIGIVLPIFNFIGLIVMFKKVGQDRKTFWSGVLAFILYLLGNTLLLLQKGKSESEEHELRDKNPPADNLTADNAVMDNSPAANLSVDNSPTVDAPAINSLIDNSSVDYSPANNSLRPSICTFP